MGRSMCWLRFWSVKREGTTTNSNIEIRNPKPYQNSKIQCSKQGVLNFGIRHSDLFQISIFVLRIFLPSRFTFYVSQGHKKQNAGTP